MREILTRAFEGVGIEEWIQPGWLAVLLPLVAAALGVALRARPPALAWPALLEARAAGARRFDAVRGLALLCRGAALLALSGVLAGPVGIERAPPEPGYGLDLVLVVDASGSMRAVDTEVAGQWRTRLDLAREVVARFAEERASEGDRVALVVFGETAFTACPLSGDGKRLAEALVRVEAGIAGEATALGDALTLGVKRALGGAQSAASPEPGAGRVVVLLSDGRANAGSVSVELATALARSEGVRVHTVAIGSAGAAVPMAAAAEDADRGLYFERHDVDREALEGIAAATGGRFFPAQRSDQLERVYQEIDDLERVARRLPPRIRKTPRPEPLLALAGSFLLAEIATARVARRRTP